jgi:hypothetical protein
LEENIKKDFNATIGRVRAVLILLRRRESGGLLRIFYEHSVSIKWSEFFA